MEKLVEGQQNQKDTKENLFRRSRYETSLQFDYEVNSVELAEKNGEIIAYDKKSKSTPHLFLSHSPHRFQ